MPFDLIPSEQGDRIKAVGMTRAGLLESALKGTFAAAGVKLPEEGAEVTRPFAIHAADFDALLAAFLDQALKLSAEHGEAYQSVAFDLITVMDAKGSYVGRHADGFTDPLKNVQRKSLKAERNEGGVWEVEIAYER
jgi:SHS2 domain-containing protein